MTDTEVSPAMGVCSIVSAVASPVIWVLAGVWAIFALLPSGEMSQVESAYIPLRVAHRVIYGVAVAMVTVALALGVASIARAWKMRGRAGRTAAIILGSIGAGLGLLIGVFYVWFLIDLQ
jgi:hypothetical protein